jgi:MFS family permease
LLQRIRFSLRALRHRDLRLFYAGQGFSLVGGWMQNVAVGWLAYRLTGSPLVLGLIAFFNQFPMFLMAPLAGALADRWSRYRMVATAQWMAMIQAAVLAVLVLTGVVQVWHLLALSAFLGVASGIDVPARQALLVRMVRGTDDLPNAIALNSAMFNAARLVGPAVAGLLIGITGEGPIFLINALTYIPVMFALRALESLRDRPTSAPSGSVFGAMREGFHYAFHFTPVRSVLLLLALISLVGMPYVVLLPVFAGEILGGGARTLGVLNSAAGLGALTGTIYLASRSTVRGLGKVIAGATALLGLGLVTFAFSRATLLSAVLLLAVGSGLVVATASINTILQTVVDESMRGRVMSLFTMAFVGLSPLGSVIGGALAVRIGAPLTVAIGGTVCMLVALWFATRLPALREVIRPIYVSRGIIPEVATGLQTASELPEA